MPRFLTQLRDSLWQLIWLQKEKLFHGEVFASDRLQTECSHYRTIAEEAYKQLTEILSRDVLSQSLNVRLSDWLELMEEVRITLLGITVDIDLGVSIQMSFSESQISLSDQESGTSHPESRRMGKWDNQQTSRATEQGNKQFLKWHKKVKKSKFRSRISTSVNKCLFYL